jgi:hypothetical protein
LNARPPPCEGDFLNWNTCCASLHPDYQQAKQSNGCNGTHSRRDLDAPDGQTDRKKGFFCERSSGTPEGIVQTLSEGGLANLELAYNQNEFVSYTEFRKTELTRKSADWIDRASRALWLPTSGTISKRKLDNLRETTLAKYNSEDSKGKVLGFAVAFLKYLAKTNLDTRYQSFELFLEKPRHVKVRKNVTSRIVTKKDIENILAYICRANWNGTISRSRAEQYTAFTVFGAFTGQRSMATMMKLTVAQFREALRAAKPVLRAQPSQDKIRMEHYVPLHPQIIVSI